MPALLMTCAQRGYDERATRDEQMQKCRRRTHHIDAPKRFHGGLDNIGAIHDRVVVGHRLAAGLDNLGDDEVGRLAVCEQATVMLKTVRDRHLQLGVGCD